MTRREDLDRIRNALELSQSALEALGPLSEHDVKANGDPVTLADTTINDVLLRELPREGEGWLSEETVDDASRLDCDRVWIVDPVDGTKEFISGIPEWCISVGLVENGKPVAGGILCPPSDQMILGAIETGVTLNGRPVTESEATTMSREVVLASRSEIKRGEWARFEDAGFIVKPMGSVAYKMGRVAAGLEAMTWTLVPKHEWDVAAGAALVLAAGGRVLGLDGKLPRFNLPRPRLDGLISIASGVADEVLDLLEIDR